MEVIFLEPRDLEPREYFEKQLDRTDKWLSFAEAKNAALVALSLAMSGVIVKWIGNPGTDLHLSTKIGHETKKIRHKN